MTQPVVEQQCVPGARRHTGQYLSVLSIDRPVGEVALASYPEIVDITLSMQERPYRPADLFNAGLENPDELFLVVDEPLGTVEVTLERS